MLCPMRSRKHFGFTHFLCFWTFLFLVLFPFLAIIRQLVPSRIPLPSLLVLSILISDIILFGNMYNQALFRLLGCLLRICLLIFLLSHFLFQFFLAIMMFWVSLSHLFCLDYFSLFFLLSFRSDGGVLTYTVFVSEHQSCYHVTWLHVLYIFFTSPFYILSSYSLLRMCVYIFYILYSS